MTSLGKLGPFMQLLWIDPVEFLDRTQLLLQARVERLRRTGGLASYPERMCFAEGLRSLSAALGMDLQRILEEEELSHVQQHVGRLTQDLRVAAKCAIPIIYNADSTLSQLAYVLCRALKAETVVETGVAYGVTSVAILAALHKNGKGALHSVELPPMGDRAFRRQIGMMVPAELKDRWHLHLGPSKRVLPDLLAEGGPVDLFIHDSTNISRVQKMEMEMVWPYLSPRAAIIVNNIGNKPAFAEIIREKKADCWLAIEQKEKKGHLTGSMLIRDGARIQ
jgi:predicted O-methyltransferase YrrM